jgi:hypothetical protein
VRELCAGGAIRCGQGRAEIMEYDQQRQDRQVVAVIGKSEKHQIRISLSMYRGRTFGDIRLFVLNQQGDWIPTRKGCTVGVEQLEELEEAVVKLRDVSDPAMRPPF